MTTLRIATRVSRLAMWQSQWVADSLKSKFPELKIEWVKIVTEGDKRLAESLAEIGGKGLFLKELETAMLADEADIAVHSLKDVPWQMPEPFVLAACMPRANPADALVCRDESCKTLADLPEGAIVGTSSLRRGLQLLRLRPDIILKPIRGNIDTRLKKLDDGNYDALVLASCGLMRLELKNRITQIIDTDIMLPAIGQGVVVVERLAKRDDLQDLLQSLHCSQTHACITAERAISERLQTSCKTPVAGFAEIDSNNQLTVKGLVLSENTNQQLFADSKGSIKSAEQLGINVADELIADGALELLGEEH